MVRAEPARGSGVDPSAGALWQIGTAEKTGRWGRCQTVPSCAAVVLTVVLCFAARAILIAAVVLAVQGHEVAW